LNRWTTGSDVAFVPSPRSHATDRPWQMPGDDDALLAAAENVSGALSAPAVPGITPSLAAGCGFGQLRTAAISPSLMPAYSCSRGAASYASAWSRAIVAIVGSSRVAFACWISNDMNPAVWPGAIVTLSQR